MSTWEKNLIAAFETRQVIILYGNVRDKYINEENAISSNLTEVIKSIITKQSINFKIDSWLFTDKGSYEKKNDWNENSRASLQELEENSFSVTKPKIPTIVDDKPFDRRLINWLENLKIKDKNHLLVINYLDKIISYQTSYNQEEQNIILQFEKLFENMSENNRIIMISLQDSMVPLEFYTFSPKVQLINITLPQKSERKKYLNQKLTVVREHINLISDLTDGLYLRDLDPIIRELKSGMSQSEIRKKINKYRLGEQEDYWGKLSIIKLANAKDTFIKDEDYGVIGQDEAVQEVVNMLNIARAGLTNLSNSNASKPRGVLFFSGPSGVGKTFLAKKLARFLFSSEDAFIRFDMSEYKEEHSVSKLIGSPPGYVGYEKGGQLTNSVKEKPFSVILFDEIEKAHPKIMDIFLQILDDGRLTDSRGQTIFFSESVIIFTSNLGTRTNNYRGEKINERDSLELLVQDLSEQSNELVSKKIQDHFRKSVKDFFTHEISRPELLNRFGNNIVAFNFINTQEIQKTIVESQLNLIKKIYEENYKKEQFIINYDKSLIDNLVNKFFYEISEFGGRAVSNLIQNQIMPILAVHTLRELHNHQEGNTTLGKKIFHITLENNDIKIEKKYI